MVACGIDDSSLVREAFSEQSASFEQEPILTITPVCYATCPATNVRPEFAVYREGTLVSFVRDQEEDGPYRLASFRLTSRQLDQLADLVSLGGLTTGDVHAAGSREGVADGSGIVFETRVGPVRTYVHAPLLGWDEPDPDPSRDALRLLRRMLWDFVEMADGAELPMRWVMLGQESTVLPAEGTWPNEERPAGQPACLEFDPALLPVGLGVLLSQEIYEATWITFGDTTYTTNGRTLLPHETGCGDVQNQFNQMQVDDASLDLGGTG